MSWVHLLENDLTKSGLLEHNALLATLAMIFIVLLGSMIIPGRAVTWLGKCDLPRFPLARHACSKVRELVHAITAVRTKAKKAPSIFVAVRRISALRKEPKNRQPCLAAISVAAPIMIMVYYGSHHYFSTNDCQAASAVFAVLSGSAWFFSCLCAPNRNLARTFNVLAAVFAVLSAVLLLPWSSK